MQHGNSFAGMTGNEILPTTLLYILFPKWLITQASVNYVDYLSATLIVNLLIIVGTWLVAKNRGLLLAELLCLGPQLLFRFDGMVMLLLILGLVLFERKRVAWSGFAIGVAVGMKVFPIIIVPYLLLILLVKKQWRESIKFLIGMGEALLIPVIAFWLMGGSWEQIQFALSFHNQKLISIESVPGSLITGWGLIKNSMPPELLPGNGIWSVAGPVAIFNKLWLLPVILTYFYLLKRRELLSKLNWRIPLFLILIFLLFSKNLNPQYLWWYMALLPFVKNDRIVIVVSCAVALLNQLVYPVFYTTLIDNFYRNNTDYWIYYLLLLRNIGIITIGYVNLKQLIEKKYE